MDRVIKWIKHFLLLKDFSLLGKIMTIFIIVYLIEFGIFIVIGIIVWLLTFRVMAYFRYQEYKERVLKNKENEKINNLRENLEVSIDNINSKMVRIKISLNGELIKEIDKKI